MKINVKFSRSVIDFIFSKTLYKSFTFSLCFPEIVMGGFRMDTDQLNYGIDAPSRIVYRKSFGYRGFIIQIIGFGGAISRQWNY